MPVGLSGAGMHPGVQLTPHHPAVTSWTCLLAVGAGPLAPHHWLSSGQEELLTCSGEGCRGACRQPCSKKQEVRSRSHRISVHPAGTMQACSRAFPGLWLLFHSPVGKHWWVTGTGQLSDALQTSLLAAACQTQHDLAPLYQGLLGRRCALHCTGRLDTRVLLY